jgi:SAM-dependent methyltransferase
VSNYPNHDTYRALYARYYSGRDIQELVSLLEPLKDTDIRLLELCCGDGRLSLEALSQGAHRAVLVDAAASMLPAELFEDDRLEIYAKPVNNYLVYAAMHNQLFDRVVCRQAVTYWLNDMTAYPLAQVVRPGGVLAFNTFNQEPPREPKVKKYEYQDHSFAEVSWLVGDTVHHVQVCEGMEPHCTSFRWIPPDEFRTLLGPYFEVVERRDGKTSLYRCVKK